MKSLKVRFLLAAVAFCVMSGCEQLVSAPAGSPALPPGPVVTVLELSQLQKRIDKNHLGRDYPSNTIKDVPKSYQAR